MLAETKETHFASYLCPNTISRCSLYLQGANGYVIEENEPGVLNPQSGGEPVPRPS